jgi:aryl-alcohol dehydrogenase-like predicted oxidoreductase
VARYLNERGLRVLASLDEVAARHGAPTTAGQVALAWQMLQPAITAPIASASTLAQLAELAAAARLVLTPQDLALLDAASA